MKTNATRNFQFPIPFLALWLLAGTLGAVDFDSEVRPVLEKHCTECHGAKKQKGELRLDAKPFALRGGVSGAVFNPGNAAESAIYKRIVSHDPEDQMPPKGERLTASEVGSLKRWIESGAAWPENEADKAAAIDPRLGHWSVQPVRKNFEAGASVDFYIRKELAKSGLTLSSPADRRTLIRRLSFDLLGLPPSPEQVESFARNPDPAAYEKLVDEFLSSPHYGERWARHWLDIAHYADTHGFERDKLRPNAWRYRDYVINAFNRDKPYDRFLREQIAGDALAPEDPEAAIATGFLAAGPWDFVGHVETQSSVLKRAARAGDLDDMLTQVVTASMAMTLNCARCHDHKLDPITQAEYYGLRAVFEGVTRSERAVDSARTKLEKRLLENETELQKNSELMLDLADIVGGGDGTGNGTPKGGIDVLTGSLGTGAQNYLKAVTPNVLIPPLPDKNVKAPFIKGVFIPATAKDPKAAVPLELAPGLLIKDLPVTSGQSWDRIRNGKVSAQPIAKAYGVDFETKGHSVLGLSANSGIVFDLDTIRTANNLGTLRFNAAVAFGSKELDPGSFADFSIYFDAVRKVHRPRMTKLESLFVVEEIPASVRFLTLVATDGGDGIGMDQLFLGDARLYGSAVDKSDAVAGNGTGELRSKSAGLIKELSEMGPPSYVYAVATTRLPKPTRIQRRGNPEDETSEVVPSAFQWAGHAPSTFGDQSTPEDQRRIALAQWITHGDNPLTRRVLVNRLWHHHFGQGIVKTPSDFGLGGDRPSHPELLDWLAEELLKSGWSIKHVHRLIVLSETYKQSSTLVNERASGLDSSNRWLWRQNPRRLDAESLRDSVLKVAGNLNLEAGGPGFRDFEYTEAYAPIYKYVTADKPELWRRSIYRFVVRTTPHRFLTTLDCPDPANLTPARIQTTTALQALALSNNGFMLEQARHWAERLTASHATPEMQVEAAFLAAYQRAPSSLERDAGLSLLREQGPFPLCRMLFNSNEFVYLD